MTERDTTRRFLVRIRDVVWGEEIYPRVPPHERLWIQKDMIPSRKKIGTTIYGDAIYQVIAAKPPEKYTYNYFQVVSLVQRMICLPNIDRITIRVVA